MALELYQKKRNFKTTPEPKGRVGARKPKALSFVIQKHAASHLHYDFRLELGGVLLSWAVPKGPSLDPQDKRLAMHVEDHPLDYGSFEGIIPPGQYGSGTVLLWDRGTWIPKEDPVAGYAKGRLKFELAGEKLTGGWILVKSHGGRYGGDKSWLLMKENDEHARRGAARIVDARPESVVSGRGLEEIASDPEREWQSNRSAKANARGGAVRRKATKAAPREATKTAKRVAPKLELAALEGARRSADPEWLAPELATLVTEAPGGDEWLHEIKYDGYRMLCHVAGGRCTIFSRNRKDWTAELPALAAAMAGLPVAAAWIDGEVIAPDAQGRSSFQALQNAFAGDGADRLAYYAFDLPWVDGFDLRTVPLSQRKRVLRELVPRGEGMVRYSDHVDGDGAAFFAAACKLGLEGIVSKRRDAAYRGQRGRDWVKVKCAQRQEMVVGGWTDPQGSRAGFGALLLGVHDSDGKLRYAGKVGTGFDDRTLVSLSAALRKRAAEQAPFVDAPTGAEGRRAHWVTPDLVAEVTFTEWTQDNTLRHPSFQGLRTDKPARDVVREVPGVAADGAQGAAPSAPAVKPTRTRAVKPAAPRTPNVGATDAPVNRPSQVSAADVVAGVTLSHPAKVLYREAGITKRELAEYYVAVAEHVVPALAQRPLTLVRCPNGYHAHCFYQKHAKESLGEYLQPVEVPDGGGTYMMANSIGAVVALVQMGVLEIHPWGSRAGALDRPDTIVMDFDPDEALPWSSLVDAVTVLRKLLDKLGLRSFLRTTGGKGLHVVVPIAATHDWSTIKAFTKAIADLMVQTFPDRFTAKLTKRTRTGKIFIDYLRNAEGATAIASYSVRAKANAPVAMPIDWSELAKDVRFDHFNLRNALARLRKRRDPWAGYLTLRQPVTAAMLDQLGVNAP